ncbi:hypothetical protein QBC43DRAFT_327832 [Cladorrhinum sp. PSN259]|nr:hypothetical protein QBC43DRAFT_327832 [Cladorrhinum sp. PSN259]
MDNIPRKDFKLLASKSPIATNSSNISVPPSGGQATQPPRPLVPLRPKTQKVKKHRAHHKNKKPPDRLNDNLSRLLSTQKRQQKTDIIPAASSTSFTPTTTPCDPLIMSGHNNQASSPDHDQRYFDWEESRYRYSHQAAQEHEPQTQSSVSRPRGTAWRRTPAVNMESIPQTFCVEKECITMVEVPSNKANSTVTYDQVLLSKLYTTSIIWKETLDELGFQMDSVIPPVKMDPRTGRTLNPIGQFHLYVKIHGPTQDSFKIIPFSVLDGSPAAAGVKFIIGEPELDVIFGKQMDIGRYNRERVREYLSTQQAGPA